MESNWFNKAQTFLRKFNIRNERKLIIFSICVGIATLFWLLNSLEKEYSVELTFPVKYTNLPKNKILTNEPPHYFVMGVRSYGFTLLRYKLSMAFSPMVFNVNEITGKIMEETNKPYYAVPSRLYQNKLAEQLSNELNVTSIQPDTVYFRFDKVITKKVKVIPDITYTLKKQHFLIGNITTKPDSVRIQGPESILDTVFHVKTVQKHYKELDRLTQRTISLQPIKKIEFIPKRVELTIPVEEYTEKELSVPVTIDHLPDSIQVNLFPDQVKVSFMVALSHFSEITPSDFRASVSYEDLANKQDYLPVKLEKIPQNLKSVNFLPKRLEYLIEK